MNKLEITYKHADEIKPYRYNAKLHPREQIEQIKQSIRQFGFNDPIAIDEDNVIIEGHGRQIAAQELGIESLPCIVLEGLTEQQKKAYILAHNKLTMNTGFDIDILRDELERITDINMGDFGFLDEAEHEKSDEEIEEDEYDEPVPVVAKSKPGDIYILGDHRLMCGDSTKEEDVEKLMNGEQADLVLTDPPYGVDYSNKQNAVNEILNKTHGSNRRTDRIEINNDTKTPQQFTEFCVSFMRLIKDSMKAGGVFYIFYPASMSYEFMAAFTRIGMLPRQRLIWLKDHLILGFSDYHNIYEPCFYGWKEGQHYFCGDRTLTLLTQDDRPDFSAMSKEDAINLLKELYENADIIEEAKPQRSDLHPTMKPIRLLARLMRNSSQRGEIVLDLFGGSGSTMIAAEQLNRRCYMMEYDPHYVDVIVERWEQYTGKKAELLKEGDVNNGKDWTTESTNRPEPVRRTL